MRNYKWNTIRFWQGTSLALFLSLVLIGGTYWHSRRQTDSFDLVSELAGNIFPSAIVSTASTGAQVIKPATANYLGNPETGFGIRVTAPQKNTKVHLELSETPFFSESVSDFVLPKKGVEYTIYPDVLWNYKELRNNDQAAPISFSVSVKVGREKMTQKNMTLCVRSINDCLLCYKDENMRVHDTSIYFAAYVNEEHPMIDNLLREALDSKIVTKFVGLQLGEGRVEPQVYALWYMLQKRKFTYSSVSYSSIPSNIIYCQRVRTLDDALEASQANCADGTVLFASLLRAINIEPVMIRVPGHMFVGYYSDSKKQHLHFLETTMMGDVSLDSYFPEEGLDSLALVKSREEMSRLTFKKAQEYATKKYNQYKKYFDTKNPKVQKLDISKSIRSKVQSIGR